VNVAMEKQEIENERLGILRSEVREKKRGLTHEVEEKASRQKESQPRRKERL
jgi:hypothetical protein